MSVLGPRKSGGVLALNMYLYADQQTFLDRDFGLIEMLAEPLFAVGKRHVAFPQTFIKSDFEISKRVVGGMVFAKILEQIHKEQVSEGDENAIRVLAIEHGSHWKKLESLLVRTSKNLRTLT